jgi:hypothetical protein
MREHRFEITLAVVLVALFAAFWWWQAPGNSGKLTRGDVDAYMRQIETRLPMEPTEKAEVLARFRAWGEADDGQPVYMLNLMRYFDKLKPVPSTEAFKGTPAQANAYYESIAMPLVARLGTYPVVGGEVAGVPDGAGVPHSNLLAVEPAVDDWSRVLVMRYPNRRAFFDLISDPKYLDVMPYKLASLKVVLVPVRAEIVVPDLRWIFGMFLIAVFLAIGWLRASRLR